MRTLPIAAAILLPALAHAADLRSGADAFGDWHADAPGVVRRITPADLPPPLAHRSDVHMTGIVPRPAGAVPQAPPGFVVTLWASGLREPRTLRAAPDGSVFVAESDAGRVLRLTADGHRTVFAANLDRPYGIAIWPPAAPRYVYVGEADRVVRFAWQAGQPAAAGPAQEIEPDLPTGGHWTRDLAAEPDGSALFVAVGSHGNLARLTDAPPGGVAEWETTHGLGGAWGQEEGRAAVFRFAPEGGPLRPYAQGLRNCAGLGVQPGAGRLWCVTDERDGLGDNLPPDYATHLTPGAFYGWPWFYIGGHPDPRVARRPELAAHVAVPDVLLQPHSAPLGIAFYSGTLFPPAYRGDAFVTLHGSWSRAHRTGYKVVRIKLAGGRADGSYEDFLTGFVLADDAVWGRPTGIAVAADGALLVSEDVGGTIWRVAPAP